MGCPVGIGPEIILRYFEVTKPSKFFRPIILGDLHLLQSYAEELQIDVAVMKWSPDAIWKHKTAHVIPVSDLSFQDIEWGKPSAVTGKAMGDYIREGVQLIQQGFLDGIVTGPISKVALLKANITYPGHTEMLADLTSCSRYSMMMAGSSLKVTLVTIHCSYKEVSGLITRERILDQIELANQALKQDYNIDSPAIAVAGLNPHSGEEGRFGNEEITIIEPAIQVAQAQGINVSGPFPPDTVFYKASRGEFDVVVCMYHDQGLIPFKLLHFEDGVNVTIGLPIVRTSVDHGTAYDIAGKGIASHKSLNSAVNLAVEMSNNRYKKRISSFS